MTQAGTPKPATPAAAKPATPATPKPTTKPEVVSVTEYVGITDRRLAFALLVVGIAVGAVAVYLALNLVIEDAHDA